ncbi:MAG: zinc-binding dehydrogenase, partial [bacterium]
GIMATAICRHAGARHIVVTDMNPFRLDLAKQMGATVALDVRQGTSLRDVQKQLDMKEGFDVGLEMSGSPAAFHGMVDNMAHGGKIAMLGIHSGKVEIDWHKVVFHMLTNPSEVIGEEGHCTAVVCQRMELGEPDDSGRRRPVPVEGDYFTVETDTLVMAIGTRANPLLAATAKNLELNKWGYIVASQDTFATSIPGVYAGGDITTGSATVIEAMGAGKRAAIAIDAFLRPSR